MKTWRNIFANPVPFWRRKWQPTPVFLPGESHGQRSLGDYNPWGGKDSDTTEPLKCHHHDYQRFLGHSVDLATHRWDLSLDSAIIL